QLARPAQAQQVADRVRRLDVQLQLVLRQPGVVEELAHVIPAGVGTEGDNQMVSRQPLRIAQRGGDGGAAGAADEDALTPRQGTGGVERLGITDAHPVIYHLAVKCLWYEVLADAFDLPR